MRQQQVSFLEAPDNLLCEQLLVLYQFLHFKLPIQAPTMDYIYTMTTQSYRETCALCRLSLSTCFCARVKPFLTRARFAVLVHPREFKKSINTARIVSRCISNSRLIRVSGSEIDHHGELRALLENAANHCVVLYPGPKAQNLNQATQVFPENKTPVVFVIDGTWHQAKKMISQSKLLQDLPRISFNADFQSRYFIREQPAEYCLSTVEAVHQVLELTEKENLARQNLLDVFEWRVQQQLDFGIKRQSGFRNQNP